MVQGSKRGTVTGVGYIYVREQNGSTPLVLGNLIFGFVVFGSIGVSIRNVEQSRHALTVVDNHSPTPDVQYQ